MKLPLSWLKEYLETEASLPMIAQTLTQIGLEVENVEDHAAKLQDFIIAHVTQVQPHPNADRLRVCWVDIGGSTSVQVVCGAPNARVGMKSVFAPEGTYIPGKHITLGKSVIRGIDSAGMLCSPAELDLSEDHDGIFDLPQDAPLGISYAQYAGLEPVLDIAITPNRSDATGVYGIARDLAAAGLGRLKPRPSPDLPLPSSPPCPLLVHRDLPQDKAHLAPAFALRKIRGVRNGPSPAWLQRRLQAIGARSINTLVDITNYLTFDQGRPLHVFDAHKVSGDLRIRFAQKGESLLALDGKTYELDETMVVIADDQAVLALAGIIGGKASGCDETTTEVLLESALWDPSSIAQTGRKLGIISDARYRFERGVDPAFLLPGLDLATQMILDIGGGDASQAHVVGDIPRSHKIISFPFSEMKRLTGLDLPPSHMLDIFKRVGFDILSYEEGSTTIRLSPPSFRPDIDDKADCVEEILRLVGVNSLTSTPFLRPTPNIARPILTPLQKRQCLARRALAAQGMMEAVTWSFISQEAALSFGGGTEELALANPISSSLTHMRPSLLPGLLLAAQQNADRGLPDLALFEVGQIFKDAREEGQWLCAAGIRRGLAKAHAPSRHWSTSPQNVDVFDAKADAMALLSTLGVPMAGLQILSPAPEWFHPGQSGTLSFGPKGHIGSFGTLHPFTLERLDVKGPVVGFEIFLSLLPEPKMKSTRAKPRLQLPDLMPVLRDFAFLVKEDVKAEDLLRVARGVDRKLIVDVALFDLYRGKGVPEGYVSMALTVTLQPQETTFTEKDLEEISLKIVSQISEKTGAQLRGSL